MAINTVIRTFDKVALGLFNTAVLGASHWLPPLFSWVRWQASFQRPLGRPALEHGDIDYPTAPGTTATDASFGTRIGLEFS